MDLTRKLKEAGRFLEVQLLDHLIIANRNYFSFADDGLI
ncbi:MAG TPA: JAB domain-containing protein [Cyclobacteriaceae bacterium]|nr:JAB domain-containing protein [Cyclobacteriaceae bacterium]